MSSSNYLQIYHYASKKSFWYDHFLGDSLDTRWTSGGTAGGSAVVVDQQTGGICRIATPAVALSTYYIDWNIVRTLLVSKLVSMEFRFKLTQVNKCGVWIYLYFDATNFIRFWLNYRGLKPAGFLGILEEGDSSTD